MADLSTQLASASESNILRALANTKPQEDGGLWKAIYSIKRENKAVSIPGYDDFSVQGWEGLFCGGDTMPLTKREQGRGMPEEEQEEPPLSLRELEGLLAPPPSFYRGHFAAELPSIIDAIGCTPLICLSRVAAMANCACQLLGKCEFLSAGGSTKDRIARGMIQVAEATGQLADGASLIEPTSGNTGIGLAVIAAVLGYHSVAVMPMKMSAEKHRIMQALGATILRTPTKAKWDEQTSHIAVSIRLQEELQEQEERKRGGGHENGDSTTSPLSLRTCSRGQVARILDQYRNPANPLSHFFGTGTELLHQTGRKLDMLVICAGTGGSLTGIGKRVKDAVPNCIIVGVDPVGSVLADPTDVPGKPYFVEGIGYDFVPTVLDREVADFWVKVTDGESLLCSRLLIRLEGMLVGGSAGAALAGAFKAIERMQWTDNPTKRVALILPDGSRNYTSKFISDEWMVDKGFLEPEDLLRQYPEYGELQVQSLALPRLRFIGANVSLKIAAAVLVESPQQVVCVVEPDAAAKAEEARVVPRDEVVGLLPQSSLLRALGDMPDTTMVADITETDVPIYSMETRLARVAQSLELRPFVLIETGGLVRAAVGEGLLVQAYVAKKQRQQDLDDRRDDFF